MQSESLEPKEWVESEKKVGGIETVPLPIGLAVQGISIECLASLGVPLLQNIARLYSASVIYPLIKDLSIDDAGAIEERLLSEVALAENRFWEIVSRMFVVQENGCVDILQADGMTFQPNEDRSSFLARAISERPEKLQAILSNLLDRQGLECGGKTFHLFQATLNPSEVSEKLASVGGQQIRQALSRRFQNRGYSLYCQIGSGGVEQQFGFAINRGGRRETVAVLDREDQRKFRDDRKIKTDIFFYTPETNTLWIHCQGKGDAQLYAEALGEIIGGPQIFIRRQSFDLSPFLLKDIGSVLLKTAHDLQLFSVDVKLIDVQLAVGGLGGTFRLPARRGERCLTEKYSQLDAIHPANEMRTVKLRLVQSADGKQHADIEVKNGSLRLGVGLDPIAASAVLTNLGVWRPHGNS